jgi:hypothetical protein
MDPGTLRFHLPQPPHGDRNLRYVSQGKITDSKEPSPILSIVDGNSTTPGAAQILGCLYVELIAIPYIANTHPSIQMG